MLKMVNLKKSSFNVGNSISYFFSWQVWFYIIMELWIWNWEEYIKMRDTGLLIDEIKQVLIQINNTLKLTLKEN